MWSHTFQLNSHSKFFPWLSASHVKKKYIYEWRIGKHCVWQRVVKLETSLRFESSWKGTSVWVYLYFYPFCCSLLSLESTEAKHLCQYLLSRTWIVNYRLKSVSLSNTLCQMKGHVFKVNPCQLHSTGWCVWLVYNFIWETSVTQSTQCELTGTNNTPPPPTLPFHPPCHLGCWMHSRFYLGVLFLSSNFKTPCHYKEQGCSTHHSSTSHTTFSLRPPSLTETDTFAVFPKHYQYKIWWIMCPTELAVKSDWLTVSLFNTVAYSWLCYHKSYSVLFLTCIFSL